MMFLGEQKVLLPCPDKETGRRCYGKVKITLQSYRIARGRGTFVLSPNESVGCKCNKCGRKFRPSSAGPLAIIFSPDR